MKQLAILGSTGSIGTQTLDVVRQYPDKFSVYALSAHRKIDLFLLWCVLVMRLFINLCAMR